jgi:hypothetical protein
MPEKEERQSEIAEREGGVKAESPDEVVLYADFTLR